MPSRGKLLPGTEHTINISFEPKSLGHVSQEMVMEILGGVYRIPLKLQGHCHKVGQRTAGVRGPMARPEDFVPQRNLINDEEAEARTLPRRKTIVAQDKESALGMSYGVQAALAAGNTAAVEKYKMIQANKQTANEFLKRERLHREKDQQI